MILRTVTYDTDTHVLVPIEPTGEMIFCGGLTHLNDDDATKTYLSMIAAAPEYQQIEMPEDLQLDWKGVDGAIAYHLIDRHADNWGDVGRMMNAWMKANQSAPEYQEPAKDGQC